MPSWTEIDSATAEVEMGDLLWGLVRMLKPEIAVETGTYRGTTARQIAQALWANGCGHLWTCDTEYDYKYLNVLAGLPATYVKCSSLDLPQLREADFVFSDSGQEIRAKEYELVKPGCVFVIHDTDTSYTANHDQQWLGKWVLSQGGLVFPAGRGFGILIKRSGP